MPDFNFQRRVKDLRPCDYGEGIIVGYVNEFPEEPKDPAFWVIRWDDSGLDNEWLEEREFELISPPEADKALIFPNGNVAIFDKNGQQIPELQGSWINFGYLRKFAEVVAKDNVRVTGLKQMTGAAQDSFSVYFGSATKELGERLYDPKGRECTCNDYPHHELCGAVQDYPDQEGK